MSTNSPAPRRRLFFMQGGVAIADQGVNSLGNFLLTLLLARALQIRDFGLYSLLFAGMMMANGLVNTLVGEPMRTLGVGDRRQPEPGYLGAQLITATLVGAVAGAVLLVVLALLHVRWPIATLVAVAVAATGIFEALRAASAAAECWGRVLAADCVAQAVKVGMIAAAVLAGIANIAWGFTAILGAVLLGGTSLYLSGMQAAAPTRDYLVGQMRTHFAFGRWLTLESLVFTLSTQLYLYLTALVVDISSVGAYSAAQTLVNVVNLLWMGVTSFSISTARSVLLREGAAAWRRWLLNMGGSLLSVVAVILLVIALAAQPLLGVLFAPQYAAYAYLVPLLACASLLMAGNSLLGATFRTIDMPQIGFHGKWVSAVVTAIISVPLVRHWGVTGAAVGMVVTQLCWLAVYLCGLGAIQDDWARRIDALRMAQPRPLAGRS